MSNKITEYDIQSAKIAEELYNAALTGKISFAEAWYNLPKPEPIVSITKIAHWETYNIDYKYLSDFKIRKLKKGEQKEYEHALLHREYTWQVERNKEEDFHSEIKEKLKNSRGLYEGLVEHMNKAEKELNELRYMLEKREYGFKNLLENIEKVKKEKEELEKTQKAYIDYSEVRKANITKEAESKMNEYNRVRDEGLRRQLK